MISKDFACKGTDAFFETATEVFRQIIEVGIANFDPSQHHFQQGNVQSFFLSCFEYLKCGPLPDVFDIVMEWKMASIIMERRPTDQELLELVSLKRIFHYYREQDIESFLDMCNQMCTNHCFNRCEELLDKR